MLRFASFASLHMPSCRLGGWSIMMRTACRERWPATLPPAREPQSSSSVGMSRVSRGVGPLAIRSTMSRKSDVQTVVDFLKHATARLATRISYHVVPSFLAWIQNW